MFQSAIFYVRIKKYKQTNMPKLNFIGPGQGAILNIKLWYYSSETMIIIVHMCHCSEIINDSCLIFQGTSTWHGTCALLGHFELLILILWSSPWKSYPAHCSAWKLYIPTVLYFQGTSTHQFYMESLHCRVIFTFWPMTDIMRFTLTHLSRPLLLRFFYLVLNELYSLKTAVFYKIAESIHIFELRNRVFFLPGYLKFFQ